MQLARMPVLALLRILLLLDTQTGHATVKQNRCERDFDSRAMLCTDWPSFQLAVVEMQQRSRAEMQYSMRYRPQDNLLVLRATDDVTVRCEEVSR